MRRLSAVFLALLGFSAISFAETAWVLESRTVLARIDTVAPDRIEEMKVLRGLQPGEGLLGIDFRPANGRLYGLGSTSRVYVIDTATGMATAVGGAPFTPALDGTEFGFDFNPTVDRIRVVSNSGQNLRLHPDTGAVAATDIRLNYEDGQRTMIVASAYTNSVAGATTTTLYGIDSDLRMLVTQVPPNDGKLNRVGMLNVDMSDLGGFDISPRTGTAFLACRLRGANASALFRVDLSNAAVTFMGYIGAFDQISGIAIP